MRTPNVLTHAGLILSAALLLSQCTPRGSPQSTSTATPAASAKDSPLQVTLLQPAPIRLDPAERTQLVAAGKLLKRNAKMVKNTPTNPQSGPWSMEQLMWDETELAPFRKLKQGVRLKMRLTNTGNYPLSFFYGPDTSCLLLTVRGRGALHLPYCGGMTLEFRVGQPVTLAPGGSREFVISELKCGNLACRFRMNIIAAGDSRTQQQTEIFRNMKAHLLPLLTAALLAITAMGSDAAPKTEDPCLAKIPTSLRKQLVLKYPNDRLPTTADSKKRTSRGIENTAATVVC